MHRITVVLVIIGLLFGSITCTLNKSKQKDLAALQAEREREKTVVEQIQKENNQIKTPQSSEMETRQKAAEEKRAEIKVEVKEWKLVEQFGIEKIVYISPSALQDKFFIAQILHKIVDRNNIVEVMFFDDKEYAPFGFPMTDDQMLHLKAQYNFNPNTGYEKFVFIDIVDKNSSPPELREKEANIRPGFAE